MIGLSMGGSLSVLITIVLIWLGILWYERPIKRANGRSHRHRRRPAH